MFVSSRIKPFKDIQQDEQEMNSNFQNAQNSKSDDWSKNQIVRPLRELKNVQNIEMQHETIKKNDKNKEFNTFESLKNKSTSSICSTNKKLNTNMAEEINIGAQSQSILLNSREQQLLHYHLSSNKKLHKLSTIVIKQLSIEELLEPIKSNQDEEDKYLYLLKLESYRFNDLKNNIVYWVLKSCIECQRRNHLEAVRLFENAMSLAQKSNELGSLIEKRDEFIKVLRKRDQNPLSERLLAFYRELNAKTSNQLIQSNQLYLESENTFVQNDKYIESQSLEKKRNKKSIQKRQVGDIMYTKHQIESKRPINFSQGSNNLNKNGKIEWKAESKVKAQMMTPIAVSRHRESRRKKLLASKKQLFHSPNSNIVILENKLEDSPLKMLESDIRRYSLSIRRFTNDPNQSLESIHSARRQSIFLRKAMPPKNLVQNRNIERILPSPLQSIEVNHDSNTESKNFFYITESSHLLEDTHLNKINKVKQNAECQTVTPSIIREESPQTSIGKTKLYKDNEQTQCTPQTQFMDINQEKDSIISKVTLHQESTSKLSKTINRLIETNSQYNNNQAQAQTQATSQMDNSLIIHQNNFETDEVESYISSEIVSQTTIEVERDVWEMRGVPFTNEFQINQPQNENTSKKIEYIEKVFSFDNFGELNSPPFRNEQNSLKENNYSTNEYDVNEMEDYTLTSSSIVDSIFDSPDFTPLSYSSEKISKDSPKSPIKNISQMLIEAEKQPITDVEIQNIPFGQFNQFITQKTNIDPLEKMQDQVETPFNETHFPSIENKSKENYTLFSNARNIKRMSPPEMPEFKKKSKFTLQDSDDDDEVIPSEVIARVTPSINRNKTPTRRQDKLDNSPLASPFNFSRLTNNTGWTPIANSNKTPRVVLGSASKVKRSLTPYEFSRQSLSKEISPEPSSKRNLLNTFNLLSDTNTNDLNEAQNDAIENPQDSYWNFKMPFQSPSRNVFRSNIQILKQNISPKNDVAYSNNIEEDSKTMSQEFEENAFDNMNDQDEVLSDYKTESQDYDKQSEIVCNHFNLSSNISKDLDQMEIEDEVSNQPIQNVKETETQFNTMLVEPEFRRLSLPIQTEFNNHSIETQFEATISSTIQTEDLIRRLSQSLQTEYVQNSQIQQTDDLIRRLSQSIQTEQQLYNFVQMTQTEDITRRLSQSMQTEEMIRRLSQSMQTEEMARRMSNSMQTDYILANHSESIQTEENRVNLFNAHSKEIISPPLKNNTINIDSNTPIPTKLIFDEALSNLTPMNKCRDGCLHMYASPSDKNTTLIIYQPPIYPVTRLQIRKRAREFVFLRQVKQLANGLMIELPPYVRAGPAKKGTSRRGKKSIIFNG